MIKSIIRVLKGLSLSILIFIAGAFIGKIGTQAVIAKDCAQDRAVTFDAWIYKQPITLSCNLAGLITLAEHY